MKKTFSSFPRKRNLSLSVREGTKSDPSGDEESCEISCHRPRIVSPGCMLVLSDDDESQLFSRAAYEILQRKLKQVFHCTSFKQWSVLKNSEVTSEIGRGNKKQIYYKLKKTSLNSALSPKVSSKDLWKKKKIC